MTPIIVECEQRSPEWFAARAGRVCGSEVAGIYARTQAGKEAAGCYNLRSKLVLERITGRPQGGKSYVSASMLQGIEREDTARQLYEARTGELVMRVGFVQHPEIMAGGSPDGVIWADGGSRMLGIVEAKSPEASAHLEYLTTKKVPRDYYLQCLHNLWVTGAEWCDWFSYQPDFESVGLHLCLARIYRNEAEIVAHEAMVVKFLETVDAKVAEVRKLMAA